MRKLWRFLVLIMLLAAGLAFYFSSRSIAPRWDASVTSNSKLESHTSAPPTPSAPNGKATTASSASRISLRQRMQSTYVPPAASKSESNDSKPAPAVAQVMHATNLPPNNGRPAAEFIAEYENDDHKSAFPNPAIALHQAVEGETPDQDWSQMAAQQLANYFTAELGNRFEFPLIQCGQDICEIQAASIVTGNHANDERDFQRVFAVMSKQPWWTDFQFDEQTLEVTGTKNGRVVFVGFVTRA